jgi:hypothetical protein
MVHRCRRPRTGHPREAQPPTKQGLPSCLINRYSFGYQTTTTGISASAYAPRYWGRPKAGGNAPRKGSLVRSIETGTGRVLPTTCGQNSQRPGVRTEQPETRRADRTVSGPACGQNSQRHDVRTQQSADKTRPVPGSTVGQSPVSAQQKFAHAACDISRTCHGAREVSESWPHKQGKALVQARPLLLL